MRSALGLVLLSSAASLACIDAPFPRVNPTDPETEITFSIAGGVDTARTVGTRLVFRVVSDPVVTGYNIHWLSSSPGILSPSPTGVFTVASVPGTTTAVTIRAEIGRTPSPSAPPTTQVARIIYVGP